MKLWIFIFAFSVPALVINICEGDVWFAALAGFNIGMSFFAICSEIMEARDAPKAR